jgi:hypothetical protein
VVLTTHPLLAPRSRKSRFIGLYLYSPSSGPSGLLRGTLPLPLPQEVCLRPYLPSGITSHVYFLKWPREGRSVVVLLMRVHRPGQWFFLSPEKMYFSSCDSVLVGGRYIDTSVATKLLIKYCNIPSTLCVDNVQKKSFVHFVQNIYVNV